MNLTIQEKDIIYDLVSLNKDKFIYKKDRKEAIKYMNMILSEFNIEFDSIDQCFSYLTYHWDKKCKNEKCNNYRKLTSIFPNRVDYNLVSKKYGIYKFCEVKECNYNSISSRQMGDNNTSHRMTEESFRSMCEKNSKKMKEKILKGEFIPNVTNSWAKSRCDLEFLRDGEIVKIKTRSTWDAYFQLFNKNLLYEKIVIPYEHNGVYRNYIVDFVDFENRIIYEIKPDSTYKNSINISKYKYAKKWCKKNAFKYKIINNKWFINNYKEEIVYGQPSSDKIIRNLKQFKNENKKYQKNRL